MPEPTQSHWIMHYMRSMPNHLGDKQTRLGLPWTGYVLAMAATALAAMLRWLLPGILEDTPYLVFYPAVVTAAAFGGTGPGLLATVVSAFCVDVLFTPPLWQLSPDPLEWVRQGIFLAGGVGISLVAGLKRAARARQLRQEEALRQSEARLRGMFDNAAVGIGEVDATGRFIAVNDYVCRILGYRREHLVGMTVHELTAPEDRPHSDRLNAELREGHRERLDYEKRYLRQDGSPVWAHVTVSTVRDSAGRPLRYIGTIEDISERRASQERLRLQAAALEAAANGMVLTDPSGAILWANQAFASMTGYSVEDAIGRNPRILKSDRQDEGFYRKMWETLLRGDIWHGELINKRKDGTLYDEEMIIAPVRGASAAITHYIAIKQDITQRKRTEQALCSSQQELQALNQTLEQRVVERTAQAEQRTAQLRALAAELTQAEQKERRHLAQVLHDHLQQLLVAARVNLGIARSQSAKEGADRALLQVDGLLEESLQVTRSLTAELRPSVLYRGSFADALCWLAASMRDKYGLTVDVKADATVEPQPEDIRVLVFEATRELLFNVVKHARIDRATVQLDRAGDTQMRLVVADEGAGCDPARNFGPKPSGGGFGLFSLRERLELLGGRLETEGGPCRGCRMTVLAPLAAAPQGDAGIESREEKERHEAHGGQRLS